MNKRLLLIVLIVAAIVAWLAADSLAANGPGYVWLYYGNYSVETTFWVFMAIVVAFIVLALVSFKLFQLTIGLLKLKGFISKHWGLSRSEIALSQFRLAVADSQHDKALALFKKTIKKAVCTPTDIILAAKSALAVNDLTLSNDYLNLLKTREDYNEFSYGLLALDIAVAEGNSGKVSGLLPKLLREFPKELAVKERALSYYESQQNWQKQSAMISDMPRSWKKANKHKVAYANQQLIIHASHIDAIKPLLKHLHTYAPSVQQAGLLKAQLFDNKQFNAALKTLIKHDAFGFIAIVEQLKLSQEQIDQLIHDLEQRAVLNDQASSEILAGAAYLYLNANRINKALELYQHSLQQAFNREVYDAFTSLLQEHKTAEEAFSMLRAI